MAPIRNIKDICNDREQFLAQARWRWLINEEATFSVPSAIT
jgi:hypothetical protein